VSAGARGAAGSTVIDDRPAPTDETEALGAVWQALPHPNLAIQLDPKLSTNTSARTR